MLTTLDFKLLGTRQPARRIKAAIGGANAFCANSDHWVARRITARASTAALLTHYNDFSYESKKLEAV